MNKCGFKISPSEDVPLTYVVVSVAVELLDETNCKGLEGFKIKNSLTFLNNFFSIKHLFEINYETDEESALICDSDGTACGNGRRQDKVTLPVGSQYWYGSQKRINKFICWSPTTGKDDFNLNIDVSIRTLDQPTPSSKPKTFEDSTMINIYGSVEKSDAGI